METQPSLSAHSPSFTSYSPGNFADIASRVISELNLDPDNPYDDSNFYSSHHPHPNDAAHHQDDDVEQDDDDDDDESEFEFAVLCGGDHSSPISADEIFYNGQIKPMFPIFNTDLVYQNDVVEEEPSKTIRLSLRRLLTEEKENGGGGASCSSSEADDLEGVPAGTYCVWTPKKKDSEPRNDDGSMRKKSKSTGSNSKRWRIRDLLHRSNSDGKNTFVFLTPSHHHNHNHNHNHNQHHLHQRRQHHHNGGDLKRRENAAAAGKKKSYLPYRQDIVGFFANGNGISRTVRPF